jgi:hypothetical protein
MVLRNVEKNFLFYNIWPSLVFQLFKISFPCKQTLHRKKVFSFSFFLFWFLALPVCHLGNLCATECNSGCLVHQSAAVSSAMTISFNVDGKAVIV